MSQDNSLPPNVRVVRTPVRLSRRGERGAYERVLRAVLELPKTSVEMGLSPHYEWQCKDERELRNTISSVLGIKRRKSPKYASIGAMQQKDRERQQFTVYIWHQE